MGCLLTAEEEVGKSAMSEVFKDFKEGSWFEVVIFGNDWVEIGKDWSKAVLFREGDLLKGEELLLWKDRSLGGLFWEEDGFRLGCIWSDGWAVVTGEVLGVGKGQMSVGKEERWGTVAGFTIGKKLVTVVDLILGFFEDKREGTIAGNLVSSNWTCLEMNKWPEKDKHLYLLWVVLYQRKRQGVERGSILCLL